MAYDIQRISEKDIRKAVFLFDAIDDHLRVATGQPKLYEQTQHGHKCDACGHFWSHPGDKKNPNAHKCAVCGEYQWVSTSSSLDGITRVIYNAMATKLNVK